MSEGPVAAIDCGTNSTRLLVTDHAGKTIERLMRITRLGQGVDRAGQLAPEAIDRTVAVLAEFRSVMDRYGVCRVRMTATSAARDASNRDTFFDRATDATGARPELLSGEEEAALSFAGATTELEPAGGPYLVADIGGGSTELATAPPGHGRPLAATDAVSLDMGCVRLTERFFHEDPPSTEELTAASEFVDDQLRAAAAAHPAFGDAALLVGLAGTVSSVASMEQELPAYDRDRVHHHQFGRSVVTSLLAELAAKNRAQRRARAGLEEGRADVIVGGLLVLDRIMALFGLDRCLHSEADILDGLAATLRQPAS